MFVHHLQESGGSIRHGMKVLKRIMYTSPVMLGTNEEVEM